MPNGIRSLSFMCAVSDVLVRAMATGQVVGIAVESEGAGRLAVSFTPAEEEKFLAMSRTPDIYNKMASSISPSISGDYTVDIKRALACLLFGGSRKVRGVLPTDRFLVVDVVFR